MSDIFRSFYTKHIEMSTDIIKEQFKALAPFFDDDVIPWSLVSPF